MVAVALAVLFQMPRSVEGVLDETTARLGYAVVGTSTARMEPLVLPDPSNEVDVAIRLKNRWRVVRDKTMPGVFRADAAPYPELFEETGPGVPYYTWRPGTPGAEPILVTPGPKTEPVPKIEREDLFRPGGVRVSVERLAALLDPEVTVPWIYRRHTARVRLDHARLPEPLALLAAIVGAKIVVGASVSADHRELAFEPTLFRHLAVATLREEARRGARPLVGILPSKTEEFALYEKERPTWLELGAQGHAAASDAELTELYAAPGGVALIEGVSLPTDLMAFAERRFVRLRKTLDPTVAKRFVDVSKVGVRLSNVRGTGVISVWGQDGSVLDLD